MASDTVGNTLKQSKGLKLGTTIRERVGGTDLGDYYRITLTGVSNLAISLKSSGANAHLQLIQDKNQNGRIDPSETVTTARTRSTTNAIRKTNLAEGVYFLRVFPASSKEALYRLTTAAQGVDSTNGGSTAGSSISLGSSFVTTVISLTNQFRQQNGLQSLLANSTLNTVALTHSKNMATQDFFSHVGPDGSKSWDRMTSAGYRWSAAGENIAAGQRTAEEVFDGWINSPSHRENLLNPNFREIGVGYYELTNDTGNVNYNRYWTQVFGTSL